MDEFAPDVVLMKQWTSILWSCTAAARRSTRCSSGRIARSFVDGKRVTDAATVEVAEMVLSGADQQADRRWINGQAGVAVGLSGKDANLLTGEGPRDR